MGHKTNIPATGRDYYFTPAGDNNNAGNSDEVPVADPQTAIERVNALVDPPSASDAASINASVTGTYSSSIVIPEFTTAACAFASIITFDNFNISLRGRQSVEFGALLNFASNGINVVMADIVRTRMQATTIVVGSDQFPADGGTGIFITGSCDNLITDISLCELRGKNTTLIRQEASSPTPVEHIIGVMKFYNINQTFFTFNPPTPDDQAVINITSAQEAADATQPTTGSMLFNCLSGALTVDAEVLQAEQVVEVADGARFAMDAIIVVGDILVKSGGDCLLTISLLVGDIIVESGSVLEAIVLNHDGVVTNNGTINGAIDGVRYGNWIVDVDELITSETDTTLVLKPDGFNKTAWQPITVEYDNLLSAFSTSNQNPIGTDNPLKIEYGAAQITGDVDLSVAGDITFNNEGQYQLVFDIQYGRTGSGSVSWLFFWLEINGTQSGSSKLTKLDGANDDVPMQINRTLYLSEGDVVTTWIVRDSQGNNSGGLITESSNIAINDAYSATVRVQRFNA